MNLRSKARTLGRWLAWGGAAFVAGVLSLLLADTVHRRSCPSVPLAGKVVQIPGERMIILRADQRILSMDTVRDPERDPAYTLRPEDGHVHPHQEERFEIVEGRARFLIGDREITVEAGQVAVVPPSTVHHWMALDGRPVRVKAEYEPALDTGAWFLSFHGAIDRGEMNLLRAAVISSEYSAGTPLPADPSPAVWRILVKVLAPIGRMLGYKACSGG
jgi:mannose-6-phosphate isomerase-like protein (cupin superfamily)